MNRPIGNLMKQCTKLICKETFSFRVGGKGRKITFKEGQEFWITSLNNTQTVDIARKGQRVGEGYTFILEQVFRYFVEKA